MNSFHLQIVTPDGVFFDGQAERISLRTITGEVGILANHSNYVTAIGMGEARVCVNGTTKRASCIGGMLAVLNGDVNVIATTFEWADDLDLPRAQAAKIRAEDKLKRKDLSSRERKFAEAQLKRALVRISVASRKD